MDLGGQRLELEGREGAVDRLGELVSNHRKVEAVGAIGRCYR
jgi:hypothetical protein